MEPLASQPDPAPYIGQYVRPMNTVVVRADQQHLLVEVRPNSGDPQPGMPVTFYGADRAVVTEGTDRGQSIEFVRTPGGQVRWIRIVGRIAVRGPEQQ